MLICILAPFPLFHAITFKRSIFTTKKCYFKNKASVALNPLVSPIGRVVACRGRKRGNRQMDLAAHAHRGVKTNEHDVHTFLQHVSTYTLAFIAV